MNDTLEKIAIGAFETIVLCFRLLGRTPTRKETNYILRIMKDYLNGYTRYDTTEEAKDGTKSVEEDTV